MPCLAPPSSPTQPTLAEMLAELAAVDPVGAELLHPEVEALEERQVSSRV
ncbi:hypothetical protein [Vitiosangium sp. GDMCC 1.1324]|nr:hypothetical protein [Vitiosangium sp. GDMCC 1.1324]